MEMSAGVHTHFPEHAPPSGKVKWLLAPPAAPRKKKKKDPWKTKGTVEWQHSMQAAGYEWRKRTPGVPGRWQVRAPLPKTPKKKPKPLKPIKKKPKPKKKKPKPQVTMTSGLGPVQGQVDEQCGMHVLNNFFGRDKPYVSKKGMGRLIKAVARNTGVPAQEVCLLGNIGEGNYDISVITRGFKKRGVRIQHYSATSIEDVVGDIMNNRIDGLLVNTKKGYHWYVIRQINGHWFDRNSTNDDNRGAEIYKTVKQVVKVAKAACVRGQVTYKDRLYGHCHVYGLMW
jgi:hypothetical protein